MLNYIGIAVTEINKREFIKELLRFIDIRPSKDSRLGEIILHGYFNFKIAKDFNLVDLHPDKKRKFHNAYTKLIESNPDALTKFKIIEVLKKEPMTRFKIAEELNRKGEIPVVAGGTGLYIKALIISSEI